MARIVCSCGTVLSNSLSPNDIQLRVYTDKEWEKVFDCESIQPWQIPLPKYEVWRCPMCKSIYVYENGNNQPIMTYRLENK
ncbi:MAG: hypothetical protein K2G88_01060 [Oscillospiraceae bacterium]|nr:hypothetical protein [Oscillospiraceae bacterium]MDE6657643.1 hypothetical protein [Oscillospiraceae bacterium]